MWREYLHIKFCRNNGWVENVHKNVGAKPNNFFHKNGPSLEDHYQLSLDHCLTEHQHSNTTYFDEAKIYVAEVSPKTHSVWDFATSPKTHSVWDFEKSDNVVVQSCC